MRKNVAFLKKLPHVKNEVIFIYTRDISFESIYGMLYGIIRYISMIKEFKQFLLRGNVVDLAVGVVIGAAFGAVVTALVADVLTPFIAAIAKVPDFSGIVFTINGSKFMLGHFINVLISFVFVAAAIFFFVIKPMNMLIAHSHKGVPIDPTTKKCKECLSDIPLEATRCAHCAQIVV